MLNDPEIVLDNKALPKTPPPAPEDSITMSTNPIWTPQKSEDLRQHSIFIRRQLEPIDRLARTLFSKAGKALDAKNAEIASLRHQVAHLQTELEAHKPRTRKKVHESSNDKFARISDIGAAEVESRKPPKRRRTARAPDESEIIRQGEEIVVQGLEVIRRAEEE